MAMTWSGNYFAARHCLDDSVSEVFICLIRLLYSSYSIVIDVKNVSFCISNSQYHILHIYNIMCEMAGTFLKQISLLISACSF